MSWKDEYKKAMLVAVLQHGTPVRPDADCYWWSHSDWRDIRKHVEEGEPRVTDFREADWQEFQGTFYEGDETRHGVEVTVACACGKYKDVTYRWKATPGEMLTQLLED